VERRRNNKSIDGSKRHTFTITFPNSTSADNCTVGQAEKEEERETLTPVESRQTQVLSDGREVARHDNSGTLLNSSEFLQDRERNN